MIIFSSIHKYLAGQRERYGGDINSHDLLKLLAIVPMLVQLFAVYFTPEFSYAWLIGQLSMPLFFFLIGYSGNFTIKFDIIFLALFLSAVDVFTSHQIFPLNILYTVIITRFLLSLAFFKSYLSGGWETTRFAGGLIFLAFPTMLLFEYGTMASSFALAGFICKQSLGKNIFRNMLGASVLCYLVFIFVQLNIGWWQVLFFSFLLIFLFCLLIKFEMKVFTLEKHERLKRLLVLPSLYLSRNSLYFYFIIAMLLRLFAIIL